MAIRFAHCSHIRDMKNTPGYLPNQRHCMYGQDADLIMLGLVTHEPHFTILREVVNFNSFQNSRNKNATKVVAKHTKESEFQLLHVSILREYLDIEFGLHNKATPNYNLESVIDDFVFMTFLVGNDFLPHMPSLDIGDGAFDLLFNTYKEQRKTWGDGQYLTHAGNIMSASRLEAFLKVIGAAETEIFEARQVNEAAFLKKKRRWDKRDGKKAGPSDEELAVMEAEKEQAFQSMIQSSGTATENKPEVANGIKPGKDHKGRYYYEKLDITPLDHAKHRHLNTVYMEGLVWCLAYYYRGCISWSWFYPYHYGPMISDLTDLNAIFRTMKYDPGEPFLPFQQLMGCLPPGSKDLVPRPYQHLMLSAASPIHDFYPLEFVVDMNGKRNPWEGVNLLPFIDAKRLKAAIGEFCPPRSLTSDERSRNSFGNILLFRYDPTVTSDAPSPNREIGLKDINMCNSSMVIYQEPDRKNTSFRPEIIPGTKLPYPGFPSLNVLPIEETSLDAIGLNCFGSESKYSSTILTLRKLPQLPSAEQLAAKILHVSVFVNYPSMHEAKVVAVTDANCEVRKNNEVTMWNGEQRGRWLQETEGMKLTYKNGAGAPGTGGVDVGEIQIRLKCVPLQGMQKHTDGATEKVFGKEEADLPLHMCLWTSPAPDPRFQEKGPDTLKTLFPPAKQVVLTAGKYKGNVGTVVKTSEDGGKQHVHVKVAITPPEPPFGLAIVRSVTEQFVSIMDAARILKMPISVLHKVAGGFSVDPGRYDLGLNIKYKGEYCVLGYTRVVHDTSSARDKNVDPNSAAWSVGDSLKVIGSMGFSGSDGSQSGERKRQEWEFSPKAIRLIASYKAKFPKMFESLQRFPNERFYDVSQLFGSNNKGEDTLKTVLEWLNSCETAKMPRVISTTSAIGRDAVSAIERASEVRATSVKAKELKVVGLKVPPSAIFAEGSIETNNIMTSFNTPPELGDRVVSLNARGVPFGARGTVIGVHNTKGCVDLVFDEEFLAGTSLQGTCSNFRGKLCMWDGLIKIGAKSDGSTVESLIKPGSGKEIAKKLVAKAAIEEKKERKEREKKEKQSQRDVFHAPNEAPNSSRSGSAGRSTSAGRSASSGKGSKLVHAKEASAPDGSIGFKWGKGRGKVSGLQASAIGGGAVGGGKRKKGPSKAEKASTEAGLKSLLGVGAPAPGQMDDPVELSSGDAAIALKGMLGIGAKEAPKKAPKQNGSDALKGMLGIGANATPAPAPVPASSPAPPPPPASKGADALMDLMSISSPSDAQPAAAAKPSSGFNFAYVAEGQVAPLPQQVPQQVPQIDHNAIAAMQIAQMQQQQMMMMNMQGMQMGGGPRGMPGNAWGVPPLQPPMQQQPMPVPAPTNTPAPAPPIPRSTEKKKSKKLAPSSVKK